MRQEQRPEALTYGWVGGGEEDPVGNPRSTHAVSGDDADAVVGVGVKVPDGELVGNALDVPGHHVVGSLFPHLHRVLHQWTVRLAALGGNLEEQHGL